MSATSCGIAAPVTAMAIFSAKLGVTNTEILPSANPRPGTTSVDDQRGAVERLEVRATFTNPRLGVGRKPSDRIAAAMNAWRERMAIVPSRVDCLRLPRGAASAMLQSAPSATRMATSGFSLIPANGSTLPSGREGRSSYWRNLASRLGSTFARTVRRSIPSRRAVSR